MKYLFKLLIYLSDRKIIEGSNPCNLPQSNITIDTPESALMPDITYMDLTDV